MSGVSSSPCRPTYECAQVSRTVFWHHPAGAHLEQILQGHWHRRHDDPLQHKDIPHHVFSRPVDSDGHSNQYSVGCGHICTAKRTLLFHTGTRSNKRIHKITTFPFLDQVDVFCSNVLCALDTVCVVVLFFLFLFWQKSFGLGLILIVLVCQCFCLYNCHVVTFLSWIQGLLHLCTQYWI